jgi:hypothetical protein
VSKDELVHGAAGKSDVIAASTMFVKPKPVSPDGQIQVSAEVEGLPKTFTQPASKPDWPYN